ncbi:Spo11 Meiosis specific double strand DNA break formation [Paramicrosporidium saccamoebae]|uniref:DNA topoisomerase (ATP-hydrolyzing) n=1 Tax=Paramicrosporidium saccamoebae TaxID=1246581 RepID=A0A2H9TJF7_9FUNG|nr:Spo11 Meiosis specific double strand DNA break formation [Paramicrosporidium saccamoebae]
MSVPGHCKLRFSSARSLKRIACIWRVLEILLKKKHGLLMTKRDIYYMDTRLFGSQAIVDSVIDCFASSLQIPRDELGVISASRGLAFGSLKVVQSSSEIDFGTHPLNITSQAATISCAPKIVIIIEKEAVFQTVYQISSRLEGMIPPFLLVTGRGFPCMTTLKFVHWLQKTLPDTLFLALVDYDPHGLLIALQYRLGSKLRADQPTTCCPSLRLLGITRFDLDLYRNQFEADKSAALLTTRGLSILKRVTERARNDGWDEMAQASMDMEAGGFTTEIESLYQQDTAKLAKYIVDKINKLVT